MSILPAHMTQLRPIPYWEAAVTEYALWIDQRYSHRFLGLGPTAWDRALVTLDAKTEGREVDGGFEVALPVGSSRLDVRCHLSVKQRYPLYYDEYRLVCRVDGADDEFEVVNYDDPWEATAGRRVTREEMEEEKRAERVRVAQRRKAFMRQTVAEIEWGWREGLPRRRNVNVSAFAGVMRSVYNEETVAQLATAPNPLFAAMQKITYHGGKPSQIYMHPTTYKELEVQLGSAKMTVIPNEHVPKDKMYVIPSNDALKDYLK